MEPQRYQPHGIGGAVLRSSGEAGYRAGFTIPVWNGQSRPVTEHRPPAWGQHGVLCNNRTLMTAFTFRSCWKRHLPHVALGSVFNIGLSKLKAWPVLPSGEDNRGVAPRPHAEGPCETTAASRAAASEHDRVPQAERRVQGPAILGSTRSTSTARVTSVPPPRPSCRSTLVSGHGDSATGSSSPATYGRRIRASAWR